MIIDNHVHVEEGPNGLFAGRDASVQSLLKSLADFNMHKIILLPIAPFISNEFIGRLCLLYPDKFLGFASVDPNHEAGIEEFEKDVKKFGLKGLKIHPRLQKINPSHKKMIRIARKCAELNLPVLLDCFPQAGKDFKIEQTFPERIGELAEEVPDAKIILAHAGGHKLWDAFAVAKAHPNIYLDFSFSVTYFKGSSIGEDLGFVLRKLGPRRCIFGSDYPEVTFRRAFEDASQMVQKIGLSSEESEYFFGKTVLSILPE